MSTNIDQLIKGMIITKLTAIIKQIISRAQGVGGRAWEYFASGSGITEGRNDTLASQNYDIIAS
jgi:hypothetical protein